MSYLKGLDQDAGLISVFRKYPETCRPLLEYHEVLLRGQDSPLSVTQRELIAAYVSGLNECNYCHGIHTLVAQRFGLQEGLMTQLLEDVDTADIEESLKPLLRYVKKLTQEPAKIVAADAEKVLAAGWNDQALYDAVSTCALFNFMNRLVEGLGVDADEAYMSFSANRTSEGGYARLLKLMEPGSKQTDHTAGFDS